MIKNNRNSKVVFRLDAGNSYGFGHLSRCLALAIELIDFTKVTFIIKTDNKNNVNAFIKDKLNKNNYSLIFVDTETSQDEDIDLIINTLSDNKIFLILDHYSINEEYQQKLKGNKVTWLQFDSHAQQNFYADYVLHASPAATKQLYRPLQKNPLTTFLLGTTYAIVNPKYRAIREKVKTRKKLNRILICFGGGDDSGATIKCIEYLHTNKNIHIDIIISSKNKSFEEIEYLANKASNISLIVNANNMEELMAKADLGIIAPGTLSYEAACLGLPMLLITIADNQKINAKGWVETGCAIGLGSVDNLKSNDIPNSITELIDNPRKLNIMSENGFKLVDGQGAIRVKNEIIKRL